MASFSPGAAESGPEHLHLTGEEKEGTREKYERGREQLEQHPTTVRVNIRQQKGQMRHLAFPSF